MLPVLALSILTAFAPQVHALGCASAPTITSGDYTSITLSVDIDSGAVCTNTLFVNNGAEGVTFTVDTASGYTYTIPEAYRPAVGQPATYKVTNDLGSSGVYTVQSAPEPVPCEVYLNNLYTVEVSRDVFKVGIEGTAKPGCFPLTYNLVGGGSGDSGTLDAQQGPEDTFSGVTNGELFPGFYTLTVYAEATVDPINNAPGSSYSEFFRVGPAPVYPACRSAPTIVFSDCRGTYGLTLYVTGQVDSDSNNQCVVTLYRNGESTGATFVLDVRSGEEFAYEVPTSLITSDIASWSLVNSDGESNAVSCPQELIQCVISNAVVRSVAGSGSGFLTTIEGSIQYECIPMFYTIQGSSGSDSGYFDAFPFQTAAELPAGTYSLTLTNEPYNPFVARPAEPVTIQYQLGAPAPSVKRRRSVCAYDEQLCYDIRGAPQCLKNLDTNIERCGSCQGPDCTELPHVDVVRCERGECIIESCRAGYDVVDNTCLEPVGLLLQV